MTDKELAAQFLSGLHALKKTRPQKNISEGMQGEMFVLNYLLSQGEFVLPGEISATMNISSARTAAALGSLEQKGMITRQTDTHDRRKVLVSITAAGRALAQEHQQRMLESTAEMLRRLGEEDALTYIRITRRLADICQNEMCWPEPPHERESNHSTEEPQC